eukprot:TRINITY_DN23363_c0_g1_i2.p1 TRINITY_DN23363_c0_g1~~TRINITY_DN23363_c0_g1_i2.p1  ORF type:complete len:183 (-),score=20.61 TRINITY_DN23363_c0_g1_i2:24-572(-)
MCIRDRCICGAVVDRIALRKHLSSAEVDLIFTQSWSVVGSISKIYEETKCVICKKSVRENAYKCQCGSVMHLNCGEFSFACSQCSIPIEIKTECCRKSISKESYSQMLIQKSSEKKSTNSLNVRCICDREVDKFTLRKYFNEGDIDNIFAQMQYNSMQALSLIHICRCRRYSVCRSRWSPYH